MKVAYSEGSLTLTARSVRMTGILAALASRSTVSQPDSTTGENAIRSTRWAMKERIALTWFSCFCWASANLRVMPSFLAASLIDTVFAVRHSLSAPTCENPITSGLAAKTGVLKVKAARNAAASTVLRLHVIAKSPDGFLCIFWLPYYEKREYLSNDIFRQFDTDFDINAAIANHTNRPP